MEMNKFYCCKGSARNNYRPRNLIYYYHLFNKPKKFDFVHQTVSRREVRVGGARDYPFSTSHCLPIFLKATGSRIYESLRNWLVLLISPHFECAWRERISVCMFVQVQACTCTSMLSSNAPHAYASRSFEVRWNQQYLLQVFADLNTFWLCCYFRRLYS